MSTTVSLTFTTLCCCSYTDQWMEGTHTAPVRKRHNLKKSVQSKYTIRDMHASSGHIDHATIAQFRQGDFVDQTLHVKNAFYFCMLTLTAWVNKTGQRSSLRTSNAVCKKTSLSLLKFDQLIDCVRCRNPNSIN